MPSHGALTAKMGDLLERSLKLKGYDVFYDHGKKKANVGKIVTWFGDAKQPEQSTELSQLDIAVTVRGTRRVLLLVEIEETSDTPKKVVGDALATLMASHVAFGKKHEPLDVGQFTTLLVLGNGPKEHEQRNMYLSDLVQTCRVDLATGNAAIGHVIIESFQGEADLKVRLLEMIPEPEASV